MVTIRLVERQCLVIHTGRWCPEVGPLGLELEAHVLIIRQLFQVHWSLNEVQKKPRMPRTDVLEMWGELVGFMQRKS
jgi:hypothetical protein